MKLLSKKRLSKQVKILSVCALGFSSVFAQFLAPAAASQVKPNVIVIFTDDQGWEDVGIYGGDHVLTPNLDQMAKEGIQLTDFYAPAPLCSPSRAALMTGSYPRRVNMATGSNFPVLLAGDAKGLNPAEVTIAEIMQQAGYATGMFGKWHLGDQPSFLPTKQGFKEFFGLPYSHDIWPKHHRQEHFKFPDLPLLDGETVIELNPDPRQLTRRFTARAIDFIKRHKDQPFFLYMPQPMPHGPLYVSPEFTEGEGQMSIQKFGFTEKELKKRNRKATYPLVVAELDHSVGQILNTLKTLGIDQKTLVIFSSDNGPSGRKNSDGTDRLLAGHKTQTLEGGMRVPTIARWPGKIPAGQVSNEVATLMDILPTAAYLAGASLPTDRVLDGKNIWPLLSGQQGAKSPYEAFFYHRENTIEAVRVGVWKLAIKGQRPGLYNLSEDPSEKQNVAKDYPNKVIELTKKINEFKQNLQINDDESCGKCRPAGYVDVPVNLMFQK
ncbi:sulfatase [Gayadomonas joobiniege]|uniref:sulfatase family protein n=1 Tax=Gayadomonas joobiniege TaxID=1234606 RepID=UPI00036CFBB8|nr:sulfatase [Gayadomonas joobiniege]